MHAAPLELIRSCSVRKKRPANSKELLKLQVDTSSPIPIYTQQSFSVSNKNDEAKRLRHFTKSPIALRNTVSDGLHKSSTCRLSPVKSSGINLKDLLSRRDRTPTNRFLLEKSPKANRMDLPLIQMGSYIETDSPFDKSPTQNQALDPYSPSSAHYSAKHDLVKQTEYIRSNPHFSRFNRTLTTLGKIENDKLLLSKELFYYPEHSKTIKEMASIKPSEEKDENSSQLLKTLKENQKEDLDIPERKFCYLKLYTEGELLPLKVDIQVKTGSFKVFVSRKLEKPCSGHCDFFFTSNQFIVDYNELNNDITCLYFGIKALDRAKISILCTHADIPPIAPRETQIAVRPKMKGEMHEFLNDITQEQLEDDATSETAEKTQETVLMPQGKNWLIENMERVNKYIKLREQHISETNKMWESKVQKAKEHLENLKMEKQTKMLFQKVKLEVAKLTKIQEEKQEKKKRKKRDKFLYCGSWMALFALFGCIKEIAGMKTKMNALRIIKKMKEMTASQIQKKMRSLLLNKIYVIRVFGKSGKTESLLKTDDPSTRTQINLFKALNFIALITKKNKDQNAEVMVSLLMQDLIIPFSITAGFQKYVQKITRIQKQWRTKRIITVAKHALFMNAFHRYCDKIMEEEAEIKKKKYSHIIPLIQDFNVLKYARKYVKSQAINFLRQLHAAAEKEKEAKIKAKKAASSAIVLVKQPTLSPEAAFETNNAMTSTLENVQNDLEEEDFHPQVATVYIKPTPDDLRMVLDKIAEELKNGKNFL